MARKKIRRPLLPLRGNLKATAANHKAEQLADILRKAARAQQTDKAQVFYSLRDVSDRFDVSLSMVAAAYRKLENEGLLTRLRGSRTLLLGLDADRHVSVHGIVGVPMSLSSFLTRQKSRMFFMSLRRELRRKGFATAGLFYEKGEARPDFLFERMKHSNVDSVLWYTPDRCARDTALLLRDRGVRVIGVADGGLPALPCRFEISREKAIKNILRDWKVRGACRSRPALVPERGPEASSRPAGGKRFSEGPIRKVNIIRSLARSATDEERLETLRDRERLEALLDSERLGHEFISADDEQCDTLLRSLEGEDDDSGIILLGATASFFAFRAPARLISLMNRRRVALVDGPVSLPFTNTPPVRADLAVADWEAVARGVTEEFLTKDVFARSTVTVFEAFAFLQAPLSEFAQAI